MSAKLLPKHSSTDNGGYTVKMDECENLVIDLEEFEEQLNADLNDTMGQSESKKSSKKGGPETKGTAMSFGFRKKLHTTPKKKNHSQEKVKQMDSSIEESISNQNQNKYKTKDAFVDADSYMQHNDNNGNAGPIVMNINRNAVQQPTSGVGGGGGSVNAVGPKVGSTPLTGSVYNRFGFRPGNVVRPASTGLTPKLTDFQENVENNNNGYLPSSSSVKRRSKSAHTGRTMTSNRTNNDQQLDPKINQNVYKNSNAYQKQKQPTHRYQQNINRPTSSAMGTQSSALINTGLHTNLIVRPTPRPPAATFSKFTLQTASLPKPQYPVPISLHQTIEAPMDIKSAKQMANNNRKGFFGPREISADSGISSLDTTFVDSNGKLSPTRGRVINRPRNLQMVMSGRHKFEVRDLDESLSCESSVVESLALPKLPSAFSADNQTIPLSGLVRSNTVLTRELLGGSSASPVSSHVTPHIPLNRPKYTRNICNVENLEEKQHFLDRTVAEKTLKNQALKDFNNSSKNSSPGSSRASWCNAGESLALKDCSSISLSSSDESKDNQKEKIFENLLTEEISLISLNEKLFLSSLTDTLPKDVKQERPTNLGNINETKFAEISAAASDFFLDDETSPTDSLVSSSDSDEAILKKQKRRINEEIQEKDLDEISPELEACSPFSPGTPTHASNSLSLSDVGRDFLIDDEIADQPALQFNEQNDILDSINMGNNSLTDTPTLRESGSFKSIRSTPKSRSALQAAIEFSLRTPVSLRKTALHRAESLDTLSPCESIASDDLMMDFDLNSSMDSIDRMSASIKSRSGSALHALDDTQLLAELESKGDDMIREWNNILRVHRTEKDSIISHLPARATRLLNRSRLQQQCHQQLSNAGSDSPKSNDGSLPRRTPQSSRASSIQNSKDTNSSNDDLLLYDRSFRNAMVQDVLYFKKQLIRLRRILQDTETLNPFDINNGQIFASCDVDGKLLTGDKDLDNLATTTNEETSIQELSDLRRQVVYLQGQVEDRDRTIRMQRNIIEKLEAENEKALTVSASTSISEKECVNTATQTDRVRPLSIGQDGLSRSKPEYTSYITHFPAITTDTTIIHSPSPLLATTTTTTTTTTTATKNQTRRHTIISTTFTNFNQISPASTPRRASIGWGENSTSNGYKPVKITLIGEPLNSICNGSNSSNSTNNNNNNNNNKNSIHNSNINNNSYNINNNNIINNNKINNSNNTINSNGHSKIDANDENKLNKLIINNNNNNNNNNQNNQNNQNNKLIMNGKVNNDNLNDNYNENENENIFILNANNHKNNNQRNIKMIGENNDHNCRTRKSNETKNGGGDCMQKQNTSMNDFHVTDCHTPTVTIV